MPFKTSFPKISRGTRVENKTEYRSKGTQCNLFNAEN